MLVHLDGPIDRPIYRSIVHFAFHAQKLIYLYVIWCSVHCAFVFGNISFLSLSFTDWIRSFIIFAMLICHSRTREHARMRTAWYLHRLLSSTIVIHFIAGFSIPISNTCMHCAFNPPPLSVSVCVFCVAISQFWISLHITSCLRRLKVDFQLHLVSCIVFWHFCNSESDDSLNLP